MTSGHVTGVFSLRLCPTCELQLMRQLPTEGWGIAALQDLVHLIRPDRRLSRPIQRGASALTKRLSALAAASHDAAAAPQPLVLPCRDCFSLLGEFDMRRAGCAFIGASLAGRLARFTDPARAPLDEAAEREFCVLIGWLFDAVGGIQDHFIGLEPFPCSEASDGE